VLIGLGLFVIPGGLMYLSEGSIPSSARAAWFILVPVFAIVFEPYIGGKTDELNRVGLSAALIAMLGALCVFSVRTPGSLAASTALGAVILAAASIGAANCIAVLTATEPAENSSAPGISPAPMAVIAGATAAIAFAIASAFLEPTRPTWNASTPELLWSAAVEVPSLLLLFWLMRRMSAPRMATRYVLAPLLAIVIGIVVSGSAAEVQPRTWLGLLLMAAGATWLLLARRQESTETTTPLNLQEK
jgi:hypothetical protein